VSDIASYLGKVVLIGVTHWDHSGNWLRQDQYHGVIKDIGPRQGIVVAVDALPEDFTMPGELECLQPAPAGDFTEKTTGTVVRDPDYLCLWDVHWPPEEMDVLPKWVQGPKLEPPGG
jgi:hypothetical protein